MPCYIPKSFKLLVIFLSAIVILPISSNEILESSDTTEIEIVRLRHTWTIKNFSFCDQKTGKKLVSPTFSTNHGCNWQLDLYPKGFQESYKDFVSLYIVAISCDTRAQYKLAILNAKQHEVKVVNGTHHFKRNSDWGRHEFVKQDFLFDKDNQLLIDDQLTILCELNVTVGVKNMAEKIIPKTQQISYKQNYLIKDLTFLFENQTFTDVIFSAGGEEFPALKTILAVRSSVFKAMFENDDQGANVTRIEITDMEPKVLNEMLRYIYTEETPNLKLLAGELLAAAEKYDLIGLKLLCVDSLLANLTVENAAEYFVLGDTYFADELKNQARSFIVAHASQVANSRGLASMVELLTKFMY